MVFLLALKRLRRFLRSLFFLYFLSLFIIPTHISDVKHFQKFPTLNLNSQQQSISFLNNKISFVKSYVKHFAHIDLASWLYEVSHINLFCWRENCGLEL